MCDFIQVLAKEIDDKYGRVDLIVNCAGLLHIPNEIKPGECIITKSYCILCFTLEMVIGEYYHCKWSVDIWASIGK